MKKIKLQNISIIILLALLPVFNAQALDTSSSPSNEVDSIHKYNALENTNSYVAMINGGTSSIETTTTTTDEPASVEDAIRARLQDITEQENYSKQAIDSAINDVNNRSDLQTFILGTSLGTLRFELVQVKGQIDLLNMLLDKTQDAGTQSIIASQKVALKQERTKIENIIAQEESKFSLFGWITKAL